MSGQNSPLYLLDASTYIFRAYHAIGHLSTRDGVPTNALYGVANMLGKFIREVQPERMVAVFDGGGPSFRHAIFPAYKANRPPTPEDLKIQFPLVRKLVQLLVVPG